MVGVGVAFLIALSWSMLAIPLGARFGIVDRPDDSSLNVHEHPAVPLGGIGVFVAVTVGMGITGNSDVGAMAAAGLLLATGLVDDLVGLRPSLRLAIQFGAGWWLVLPTQSLVFFGIWIFIEAPALGLIILTRGGTHSSDRTPAAAPPGVLTPQSPVAPDPSGNTPDDVLPKPTRPPNSTWAQGWNAATARRILASNPVPS